MKTSLETLIKQNERNVNFRFLDGKYVMSKNLTQKVKKQIDNSKYIQALAAGQQRLAKI